MKKVDTDFWRENGESPLRNLGRKPYWLRRKPCMYVPHIYTIAMSYFQKVYIF
jgi:hypothetical protein